MGRLRRLDSELVRRNLARSRTQGGQFIASGLVSVDGEIVTKAARQIDPAQAIVVHQATRANFASRGGYKLAGALAILGEAAPQIAGRRCLDAGASTGGFTDVLLRAGASQVVAVDVGYGQLAWSLQSDHRVIVLDRTNIRYLKPEQVAPPPELVVGDMSFISLTLVLEPLVKAANEEADFLLLVKPQFEVGKEALGAGGVVRDLQAHRQAIAKVANCAQSLGLSIAQVVASPLPGPAGNIEYFLAMRRNHPQAVPDLEEAIWQGVEAGPKDLVREGK